MRVYAVRRVEDAMTKKEFIKRLRGAGLIKGKGDWESYEAGKKIIPKCSDHYDGDNYCPGYNRYIKWLCEYVGV